MFVALSCGIKLRDTICWVNNVFMSMSQMLAVMIGDAFDTDVLVVIVSNFKKLAKAIKVLITGLKLLIATVFEQYSLTVKFVQVVCMFQMIYFKITNIL